MERLLSSKADGRSQPLSEKIDDLDNRLTGKIDEQGTRPSENDKRLSKKIDNLDKRLDIVQRLAVVEVKLRDQEQARR